MIARKSIPTGAESEGFWYASHRICSIYLFLKLGTNEQRKQAAMLAPYVLPAFSQGEPAIFLPASLADSVKIGGLHVMKELDDKFIQGNW